MEVYDSYFVKKNGQPPRSVYDYHKMLNVFDTQLLLGQRPNVWWTRDHDIDLIIGTYKYGYADYQSMIGDLDLGFSTLEKVCEYSEFPNADSLTRRLKKLVSLIVRHEKTHKGFDFENSDNVDTIMKEFSPEETKLLFEFVSSNGVQIGSDLRPN